MKLSVRGGLLVDLPRTYEARELAGASESFLREVPAGCVESAGTGQHSPRGRGQKQWWVSVRWKLRYYTRAVGDAVEDRGHLGWRRKFQEGDFNDCFVRKRWAGLSSTCDHSLFSMATEHKPRPVSPSNPSNHFRFLQPFSFGTEPGSRSVGAGFQRHTITRYYSYTTRGCQSFDQQLIRSSHKLAVEFL